MRVTPLGEADEGPDGGFGDGKDQAQDGTTGIKKKKKLNIICLRRSAYFKMAESKSFSTFVYVTIIASSIMLAFETPAEQVSRKHFPSSNTSHQSEQHNGFHMMISVHDGISWLTVCITTG